MNYLLQEKSLRDHEPYLMGYTVIACYGHRLLRASLAGEHLRWIGPFCLGETGRNGRAAIPRTEALRELLDARRDGGAQ